MKHNIQSCSAFNPDSSETVAYNNPLFPVYARYGILSSYPDYTAISHWHRDLEFIVIMKGAMTYSVNGVLVELTENHGIMVNSRQLHYGFSPQHEECEFICILLSPELLEGNTWFCQNYIEPVTENAACPYLHLAPDGWQGQILEILRDMYLCFDGESIPPAAYFTVLSHFVTIMEILYENTDLQDNGRPAESAGLISIRNMIKYIEEHYREKLTLENIALSGTCCKSHCSLLFKKYLNDTPAVYVTKLRLRKSLTALLTSDMSMTDIAYEYGFCTASYYCETFKKYYGVSPLAYRKAGEG